MTLSGLAADLEAEQVALDQVVEGLSDDEWELITPSPDWTVGDQIGHLSYFDGTAALAIEDPVAFRSSAAATSGSKDIYALTLGRDRKAEDRFIIWRENRNRLSAAIATLEESSRVPWYGPEMGAKSFVTARLMECWAHGQDVRDALAIPPSATERLAHIARLGFMTRGWSYINRGLETPTVPVRIELTAPSGDLWVYGPGDAVETVKGTAVDFCLVVTQRRSIDETEILVEGESARDWMEIAQAFAGRPTSRSGTGQKT